MTWIKYNLYVSNYTHSDRLSWNAQTGRYRIISFCLRNKFSMTGELLAPVVKTLVILYYKIFDRYAILWSSIPPYRNLLFFCFIHQSKVLIGWSDKMRRNMKINFIFCYGLPRARTRSLEILSGWLKTNVEKYQTRSTGPVSRAPVQSYSQMF